MLSLGNRIKKHPNKLKYSLHWMSQLVLNMFYEENEV